LGEMRVMAGRDQHLDHRRGDVAELAPAQFPSCWQDSSAVNLIWRLSARGRNMHKIFATSGMLAATLGLGACATVTRGDHTAWEVNTIPPGAHVTTTNGFSCDSTPCSIRMPRKSEFTARITKAGYRPLQVSVTNHVSGAGGVAMAGNVLVGGLIGAGVDVATGAMLDLSPNPVNVTLESELRRHPVRS